MSCNHGNWPPCDECDEEDAAFKDAYKSGYESAAKELTDLTMKHLRRAEAAESKLARVEKLLREPERVLSKDFNDELFAMCRNDDYVGIFSVIRDRILRQIEGDK